MNLIYTVIPSVSVFGRIAQSAGVCSAQSAFSCPFIKRGQWSCEWEDLYTIEERWRISTDLWARTAVARHWQLLFDIWTEFVKKHWRQGNRKLEQQRGREDQAINGTQTSPEKRGWGDNVKETWKRIGKAICFFCYWCDERAKKKNDIDFDGTCSPF